MKSLVLCTCVLIIAFQSSSSSELKNRLKSAVKSRIENDVEACMTENDMTIDDAFDEEDIMNNLPAKPENAERTRKNGCVIACILKKQNLMEGTNINEAQVRAKINEMGNSWDGPELAMAHKVARKCIKKVKNITQECEKGWSLNVCIAEAIHKIGQHDEHDLDQDTEDEAVTEAVTEQAE
ncbi:pheromone-binding protein Gp-9-like [Temnothorax curvispinosus]|uniref:Pheromone-binding protein Gp-9-like n=1 Tax=Temnothorax curvispinosus TaxID=300111 RepID=A0A6J1Q3E5_9HYME|nr:pheromone-binding protein Gp-9-like [Temnothorax curvispinosus]